MEYCSIMNRSLPLWKTVLILIITLIVSFLLFYDFGNSGSRIIDTILSYGHLLLFGLVALASLKILNKGNWLWIERSLYVKAWAIASFLGVLTECIQAFIPYRHFRLTDILTDALGAAGFLVLFYPFKKGAEHRGIVVMRNILLVLMIIRAYPIVTTIIDTRDMEKDFPLLSSMEAPFEISRWTNKESEIEPSRLHATEGEHSLKVNFLPGVYPGVSLNNLVNEWRDYKSMSFDVFLDEFSPLKVTVRINDRLHNEEYTDRFNRSFQLQPGVNHISIGLEEVKKAPHGREMNISDISNICIFCHSLKQSRTVYFDNFRLDK
jgi:VanZ family protein